MPSPVPAPPTPTTPPTPPGQSRYGALADVLRQRIVSGQWAPGSALPAEQALAAQHGVALGTMRRALEVLAEQGLLQRVHGRGTFVRQALSGAPMLRFFRFGQDRGAGTPHSRILARATRPLPVAVAQALGEPPGAPGLRLQRLRSLAGQPVLHETLWLPLPLFAPLADGPTEAWGDLLYPLFAQACGVHVQRAVDTIGFGQLAAAPARALQLPTGHPCAQVQRLAHDLTGRCIEWRCSLGDAHAFQYTVAIT